MAQHRSFVPVMAGVVQSYMIYIMSKINTHPFFKYLVYSKQTLQCNYPQDNGMFLWCLLVRHIHQQTNWHKTQCHKE